MKTTILTFTFLFFLSVAFAQTDVLQIQSVNSDAIDYCTGVVKLGNRVGIQGPVIQGGLKISISNYQKGEDHLSFQETSKIKARWDDATGTLILSGNAAASEYQDAVQNIEYTNLLTSPTNGTRRISITLKNVDYLPETEHFYRYIRHRGISWTEAKKEAEEMNYYGLHGYLVTILSRIENDFVWTKVKGVGWIGASDEEVEGDWKWMTGPDAGTLFWRGTYNGGSRVDGRFSFWSNGEPNNSYPNLNGGLGEDYAHINQNPSQPSKSWNDLRNEGDGSSSEYYYPQGYIVEFGGMPNDPDVSLSAVLDINVWNIDFDDKQDITICQNQEIRLNHEFAGNYEWTPTTGLDDPYISNPLATPMDTTIYKVVSRNGTCVDSALFKVNVKPSPKLDLGGDKNICEGSTSELDAGSHDFYEWSTGDDRRSITATETGSYKVRVGNNFNCFTDEEVAITFRPYPVIDLTNTDTLFCDQKTGEVKIEVDHGNVEWQPISSGLSFGSLNSAQSSAKVVNYGTYKTKVSVESNYGCITTDSLNLNFYNIPTSKFSIDDSACYGYNLKVMYEGDGTVDATYNWFFLDSVYASGVGITDLTVALGFESQDKRDLGLLVNERGCLSDTTWQHINVIPNLNIFVADDEGCEPFLVDFSAETTESVSEFYWDYGDGGVGGGKNSTYTYAEDGTYDVGLRIISNEGCENYGLIEELIKVRPVPSVETNLDPDSCFGHTIEVQYMGSANPQDTYHWGLSNLDSNEILEDPGVGQRPFEVSLKNKPESTISLQITTEFGCESDKREFSFKRKPWVQLVADPLEGCPPLDVSFQALPLDSVDALTYLWSFNQGNGYQPAADQLMNTFYTPDHEFNISSIAKSSVTNCVDTAWLDRVVRVFPKPTASFRADTTEVSIVRPNFEFENRSENAQNYYWDFGDSLGYSTDFAPAYSFNEMGWFDVELIAENEFLCTDTAYQEVLVAFDRIFPPNAFSPNSSNTLNQQFLLAPKGILEAGYHLQIFNRWGERIFEVQNVFEGWDGKTKSGQNAPTGVYIWLVDYQDFINRIHQQGGTVTLVY